MVRTGKRGSFASSKGNIWKVDAVWLVNLRRGGLSVVLLDECCHWNLLVMREIGVGDL
jgi:hypothetical protein